MFCLRKSYSDTQNKHRVERNRGRFKSGTFEIVLSTVKDPDHTAYVTSSSGYKQFLSVVSPVHFHESNNATFLCTEYPFWKLKLFFPK